MKSPWINYTALRERLDFKEVLEAYGVEARFKGTQAIALCPFPDHDDKKTKSFSANTDRNIFQCFGCHAKGNVLEFAVMMEGYDPEDAQAFREGAIKVQARFSGSGKKETPARADTLDEGESIKENESSDDAPEENVERVINAPLDFALKSIDARHAYLTEERGLTPATIETFGLGYCNRGMMKGRVVIPLHNIDGQLIGYAGRLIDDEAIDDDHPKYLLPGKRNVKGVAHEFWKSEILFNGHRLVKPPAERGLQDIILVEGFFQTICLHQCGYPNVVGVMGSSLSEKQATLIERLSDRGARIYLLPDGDKAGEKLAECALMRLSIERWMRWIRLPGDNDIDNLSESNIKSLFDQIGL